MAKGAMGRDPGKRQPSGKANRNTQSFPTFEQGPQTDPGFMLNPTDMLSQLPASLGGIQHPIMQYTPEEQQRFSQQMVVESPGARAEQGLARGGSPLQQTPTFQPWYNPPMNQIPQQSLQRPVQQIQTAPPMSLPSAPQQPAPSYLSGNQNRVRQSAGVYKDPATGALYNSKNQMIRRGR